MYGPDYYPGNFSDGPLPIASIRAKGAEFVILKYSEGTNYIDWAVQQGPRVRSAGMVLGGYHMLSGPFGSGGDQARYFLNKFKPQPGDMVPIVDYESIGQGTTSDADYKAKLLEFIPVLHAAGFECMLYGHAEVKRDFGDWTKSGADYWWVPGSQPWADCGPRGPDLWQYGPYVSPPGFPTNFRGDGAREDASKVMTQLPVIGADMADPRVDAILAGMADYLNNTPPAAGATAAEQRTYKVLKDAASKPPAGAPAPHEHTVSGKAT